MTFTFRTYEDSDQAAVLKLHREALGDADSGEGSWDDDLTNIIDEYPQRGGEFLIVEKAGHIVGMGAIRRVTELRAEVKRMRVVPKLQRQGIGTEILARLEQRAVELGYQSVELDTREEQMEAQQFYVKHGYQEVRRKDITGFSSVLYEKTLV